MSKEELKQKIATIRRYNFEPVSRPNSGFMQEGMKQSVVEQGKYLKYEDLIKVLGL